ncbi:MAG: hypothetical protein NTX50_25960 [Candidatus Sumerlaeota bacterium]|nr:hypothetical protein [Candidatus Sumerlaeota bacterium]
MMKKISYAFFARLAMLLAAMALLGAAKDDAPKVKTRDPKPKAEFMPRGGANMVVNGDFTKGDKFPEGWEPMPPYVEWIDGGGECGKCIHFKVPAPVAQSTGVKYWSDYIEVKTGHTYLFNFDCKVTGGLSLKVFLKGYFEIEGARREGYQSDAYVYGVGKEWQRYGRRQVSTIGTPSGRKVKWVRFMLLTTGGNAGEAWWDNFWLEEIENKPEKDL